MNKIITEIEEKNLVKEDEYDSDDDWDHSVLDSDSDDDNTDDNQVENLKDDEPIVNVDAKRITYSICKKGMSDEEIDQIPNKEKMVITFKVNMVTSFRIQRNIFTYLIC